MHFLSLSSPGSSSQHPELELEGGRWRHLPRRAEAGLHRSELPGPGSVHHAGQPLLHEVLHQGQLTCWSKRCHRVNPERETHNLLCLDWRRHMAEVLFRGSSQWNVHGVSVQCLRGFVFPHHLWVSMMGAVILTIYTCVSMIVKSLKLWKKTQIEVWEGCWEM